MNYGIFLIIKPSNRQISTTLNSDTHFKNLYGSGKFRHHSSTGNSITTQVQTEVIVVIHCDNISMSKIHESYDSIHKTCNGNFNDSNEYEKHLCNTVILKINTKVYTLP